MSLPSITPQKASQLIKSGALLVDIRSKDEHAREHIASARHIPMESIDQAKLSAAGAPTVIFHCRSGNRTQLNAKALAGCAPCEGYLLEGGLDAWKQAGLPVTRDATQPLELQRQVQIAAGALVVIGAVMGYAVSPWFHLLSAFVGGGLVFAGVSGFCGLARVLMMLPWNQRALAV